jgi:hypothetical protein
VDQSDRAIQWLLDNREALLEEGSEAVVTTGAWDFQSVAGKLEATLDRTTRELSVATLTNAGVLWSEIYLPYIDTDTEAESLQVLMQLAAGLSTVFALDDPEWRGSLPDPHRVPDEEMVTIVPWHRIADDFRRTTGKELTLQFSREEDEWWDVEMWVDGVRDSGFGRNFPNDAQEFLAALADIVADEMAITIWGGWPICPEHLSHPLEATVNESTIAVWRCPSGQTVFVVGTLTPNA